MITRTARFTALAVAAGLALTGCATSAAETTDTASEVASAADSVVVVDAWVKAVDEGMTAAFGEFENDSDADVTIVSASTAVSSMVELHETAMGDDGSMSMSEVEGGFVVPAGGTHLLAPGADHIMLMGVTEPLVAGDEVTVTVTFSDDSTLEFSAPVKDYTGANEDYEGEDTEMDE